MVCWREPILHISPQLSSQGHHAFSLHVASMSKLYTMKMNKCCKSGFSFLGNLVASMPLVEYGSRYLYFLSSVLGYQGWLRTSTKGAQRGLTPYSNSIQVSHHCFFFRLKRENSFLPCSSQTTSPFLLFF